jgi:hypothetical protein
MDEVFVFLPAIDTEAQTSTSPLTIGITPGYRTPGIIPEAFTIPFASSASRNEEIRAQETPPDRRRIPAIAGGGVTNSTSPSPIKPPSGLPGNPSAPPLPPFLSTSSYLFILPITASHLAGVLSPSSIEVKPEAVEYIGRSAGAIRSSWC